MMECNRKRTGFDAGNRSKSVLFLQVAFLREITGIISDEIGKKDIQKFRSQI